MTGPAETTSGTRAAAPAVARPRAPRRLGNWGHRNARWLFPAPAVLLVAAIIVYPIVYTVWMSLQDWFASSLTLPKFIGLANYQKILVGDPRFRRGGRPHALLHRAGDRRRDGPRRRDGTPVQPGVLGARPPADARDPAHGGDPRRHRARVRDDVPPDARGGELPGLSLRLSPVQVDLLERDGALRARAGGHLAVDAPHHADRAGRPGEPARRSRTRPPASTAPPRSRRSGTSRCRSSDPPSSSRSSSGPSTRSRRSTSSSS